MEVTKQVWQSEVQTIDFEKAFISLQALVNPLKLGHKTRIFIDYDSSEKLIRMNYLEVNKDTDTESLPDNMQFNYARENGGVSREYGVLLPGCCGQDREYCERHMKSVFEMLGIKGLAGKVRVIVDYDPDKEKVSIKHFNPDEVIPEKTEDQ